jgi:hypothetical protein
LFPTQTVVPVEKQLDSDHTVILYQGQIYQELETKPAASEVDGNYMLAIDARKTNGPVEMPT